MADNIRFKEWQSHDGRGVLTREDSIRHVLAFAGIHDTDTEVEVSSAFATGSLSDFETGFAEGTWVVNAGKLQGTGGGAAQWYKILCVAELNLGWVAEFDKFNNRSAFVLCSTDSYYGYIVWWDATHVAIEDMNGTTLTQLSQIDCGEAGNAKVTVAAVPISQLDVDQVDDVAISVWFDDHHLLTCIVPYDSGKGDKVGFAVYGADVVTFDNLFIPELYQPMSWTSVDPGEHASAGYNRVSREGAIKVRARYDGSVKIWRPESGSSIWTVPDGRFRQYTLTREVYVPTHYRLVGAKHEVDNFRSGNQGHIFDLGQDPNALGVDEVTELSSRMHKDIEEEGTIIQITAPPNPVIESEDIITMDGTERRVTMVNYTIAWRGSRDMGAPVLESTIILREKIT